MSGSNKNILRITPVICLTAMTLLFGAGIPGQAESADQPPTLRNKYDLGEKIYREGVLPSGKPMRAVVKGSAQAAGTAFSCVSCHMRSGFGSAESGAPAPSINGTTLFKPVQAIYKGFEQKIHPVPPLREAYNDASLAEVIRSGKKPSGALLSDIMPRYELEDQDMAILVSYLKTLSTQLPPGVSETTLRFATVITDDVPPDIRHAMLAPLQQYVDNKNRQAEYYQSPRGKKTRLMVEKMFVSKELSTRRLELSQWVLKGSPDTWRSQLDEYNRKDPVFALLGGISGGDWRIMHQFSEENRIPCLLPQTDFSEITAGDWYTIYPSKGYFQEGESAARYLNSRAEITADSPVVQIVRESREGNALSSGFDRTWRDLERRKPVTVMLKSGEKITEQFIERLLRKHKPAAIVLWDGLETQSALGFIAAAQKRPELVLVSARYLDTKLLSIPERARAFTYITYPFSFAQKTVSTAMGSVTVEDDAKTRISLAELPEHDRTRNALQLSTSITQLLTMALMEMKGNYYRDNFLDVISVTPDQPSPLFGRLSFGPGERYASKGCYIVQITAGPKPEVVRKSAWVIH